MKPVPGEAKMNKAAAHEPKSGHMAAAGPKGHGSDVGGERKAATAKAQTGQPTDGLSHAVSELKGQHPHHHSDHGPHHGDSAHIRHKPYSMR